MKNGEATVTPEQIDRKLKALFARQDAEYLRVRGARLRLVAIPRSPPVFIKIKREAGKLSAAERAEVQELREKNHVVIVIRPSTVKKIEAILADALGPIQAQQVLLFEVLRNQRE